MKVQKILDIALETQKPINKNKKYIYLLISYIELLVKYFRIGPKELPDTNWVLANKELAFDQLIGVGKHLRGFLE